ncbi:MAG: cyclic pyranopterin monophosphate synthase MoaC [Promethearchaeati archaeon SRVP18_Atabeyarchaeia-1]
MSPVQMADIAAKSDVPRTAISVGRITLKSETIKRLKGNSIEKGDVVSCAQIAGILSAKKTHEIIPLCHPVPVTSVVVNIDIEDNDVIVTSEVSALAKTGVEMESLTATAVALLTVWDMTKKYEKDEGGQYPSTKISDIRVLSKIKGAGKKNDSRGT